MARALQQLEGTFRLAGTVGFSAAWRGVAT
jgi:hypothetical protein